jgi:transcriptional regulator of acetoin/glycerol metabolism/DNA-binding CsgD family transcriptional regulator
VDDAWNEGAERALRHVLERIDDTANRGEPISDAVRQSWRRAAHAGLQPELIHPPYDPNVDHDGRLRWAAAAAMTAVSADLPEMPAALLLTDRRVHVIERWTRTARTAVQMDRVGAAPGFRCEEAIVGTNSIGMAANIRGAAVVRGFEHYADAFTHITCASRAVLDPFTGQVVGVVNMTCVDPTCSDLMPALIGRVVHETEARLRDESGAKATALYQAFLQARRQARGAIAAVDSTAMYVNSSAGRIVASTDREAIWEWARRSVATGTKSQEPLALPTGSRTAQCELVYDGADLVGAIVRFHAAPGPTEPPGRAYWSMLTESERSVAECVATGLTNRETATKLFISPHTVDYHLRQIFRKLDLDSRVELARLVEKGTHP